MPAVFNGAVTIGGCAPGLQDAFNEVGSALETLRDEVVLHLPCFLEAIAGMAGVRIAAVQDFQVQLNAAVGIQAQLTAQLANPTAYLQQLISALEALLGSVPALVPQIALRTQIAAAGAVEAVFAAKIAAVDGQIAIVVSLLNACYVALLAVSTAAFSAIEKYHTFRDLLATAGAFAISYTGTLTGLGAGIDSVTAATGIPGATQVTVTVQIVKSSDGDAVGALTDCFLVA